MTEKTDGGFIYCPASAKCRTCDGLRAGVSADQMMTGDLLAFRIDLEAALADQRGER
jgi:hypothetical protein